MRENMKGVRPYFRMLKHLDAVDARKLRRLFFAYASIFIISGLGLVTLLVRVGVDRVLVMVVSIAFVVLATIIAVSLEYYAPKDWTGPR